MVCIDLTARPLNDSDPKPVRPALNRFLLKELVFSKLVFCCLKSAIIRKALPAESSSLL